MGVLAEDVFVGKALVSGLGASVLEGNDDDFNDSDLDAGTTFFLPDAFGVITVRGELSETSDGIRDTFALSFCI